MVERRNADLISVAPLSMAFFLINLVLYGVEAYYSANLTISPDVSAWMGASMRVPLWEGEWLRLIAPNFLHGSLLHIILNNFYLFRMGPAAEVHFGTSNFGTLYLLSGVSGFCVSQLAGTHAALGASAALFGIMAAYLSVTILNLPRARYAWRNAEVRRQVYWILAFFAMGISGILGGVDNWAHLGGFVVGGLLGAFFELWRSRHRLGLALIAGMILLIASLICVARWTFFLPEYHIHQALLARERRDSNEEARQLAAALEWGRAWHVERGVEWMIYFVKTGQWTRALAHQADYAAMIRGYNAEPQSPPLPQRGEGIENVPRAD